jgi:hypothetical protein
VLVARECCLLVREMAKLRWRSVIGLVYCGVESAYATESRSLGHVAHRQAGFVDQLLRKLQAPGVGDGAGRCSQVLQEQSPEMARANSQTFRQKFHSTVLQTAFTDQSQSTRNSV